ncbi:type IV secretion system protein [Bartonella krasnovii]|uniref:type IV secretion system protein n=1 Tax=Bartonella krasnovii TaxID=2267275 RepID=UPI001F4C877F|nr:type IV secretion system protein [Bartonella krasnovii]UNF38680.1 type IV secretion system protein [Bartonella krasnovii]UNF38688.1 type IV secretion system protein [Bartonella krasnovii]UNF38691.1 type IV secretion system protein [Bartonella krasnovii]UNF50219.1 type IV secretion system protein [Bartonella krasnovii]UNF50222.1 type IV secretion system protein [Bartonella krasnovii]
MTFTMFTQLFTKIDQITQTYVTETSSKAIVTITPFVSVGLTISFIIYGWLIMRGAIDMPLSGFVNRFLRISIITSIALTAGLYQPEITSLITQMPYDLSKALIANPLTDQQLMGLLDKVAGNGFQYAGRLFQETVFFEANGLLYSLLGILILLSTSFVVAIGGGLVILTKIAITLLVGLGPFFITALLWQPTHRLFQQWLIQVVNYIVLFLLLATVFNLMMNIFANYLGDMKLDYNHNVSFMFGGALILSIISIMLLLKLSSIASSLAKGMTFGHLWRHRN